MFYKRFIPPTYLVPFVECMYVWQSDQDEPRSFESPPTGFCSIVFNSGSKYNVDNSKYSAWPTPDNFATGQAIRSYQLNFEGRIAQAGIVFRPTGLFSMFNFPMYTMVEQRVALENLLPEEIVTSTAADLKSTGDPMLKKQVLVNFLDYFINQRAPVTDFITLAANRIVEQNGLVQIDELIAQSFMTRRTFERKFLNQVGLSPKYYARIRRISYLCNIIAGKEKVDWQHLLHSCEYFDQAHFIRDFESFTGRSPQIYLDQNIELKKYLQNLT
ncbi:MAG: AraC family transcriptional regulator [Chitinophagaceae bacterium]